MVRTMRLGGRPARWLLALALAALVTPAGAHKRDFVWTYEWFTPAPGERELETWYTYSRDDNAHDLQLEYETGLSLRWSLGLYALFRAADTGNNGWNGLKAETRYRFGDFAFGRVLHAGYLELAKKDAKPWEVEGKWILSLFTDGGDAFALNLVTAQELAGEAVTEFELTGGWSRRLGDFVAGLEGVAEFTNDEYFAGPTFGYDFNRQSRLLLGVAAGLNSNTSDVQARALWEYEW